MSDNFKIIKQATIDISPLALAVIPWGILSGTIAINIGLTLFQAQAMSLFIFAGAAQLSAMTLLSGGLVSYLLVVLFLLLALGICFTL